MKRYKKALAIISTFLVLPYLTCMAFAQSSNPATGEHEAAQMVPAQGSLTHNLDAKKMKPGSIFKVELSKSAKLHNGTMLPKGTVLLGKVTMDQIHPNSQAELALNFSQARLKDGEVVPIKATIVGIVGPEYPGSSDMFAAPGDQQNNTWNDQTLQFDQLGVRPGLDLHSKIAGANSGVLVDTKGHDVSLKKGSEIELAIAPRQQSQQPGV